MGLMVVAAKISPPYREPNGRRSRKAKLRIVGKLTSGETEVQAMAVALDARKRLHGFANTVARDSKPGALPPAADPLVSTVVGRLHKVGRISVDQYQAAQKYEQYRAAYLAAIAAPGQPLQPRGDEPLRACEDCGRTERCDACSAEWAGKARARWAMITKAIADEMMTTRRLPSGEIEYPDPCVSSAMLVIVELDQPAEHLEKALGRALSALDRYFNLKPTT